MTDSLQRSDLVLFGVLGDLSRRKLIPALYQLDRSGLLHQDSKIIGVARDSLSDSQFEARVKETLKTFVADEELVDDVLMRFCKRFHYVEMDFSKTEAYQALKAAAVEDVDRVFYLATPPSLYATICAGLSSHALISESTRVILEKPIGHNLASSQTINQAVAKYFQESQIYRIDHYLGKETVLNLLALRFANALFASNWDNSAIDHIQITAAEKVGVEGRWGYYDDAGQLRDMVQNHLLQVLSLIAMEPPSRLDAESIREEKLKVLKALRPIDAANSKDVSVRGQYQGGFSGETKVPGYLQEEGARQNSDTETFVALKVNIDNWRWSGVPFYLRTGKRMPEKRSEVVITFKKQPHNIFNDTTADLQPNKLVIRLQPDEGVEVQMLNKIPGLGKQMHLKATTLDLSFDETFEKKRIADAYERLMLEAMQGNQYLFVHRDEVEYAWRWVDGILAAWEQNEQPPKPYHAGTWGPVSAVSLLAHDGRQWDE
ncbi:glucose-6-phosphate 1-dehydrogenase [Idiomarina fontislapidosi]|uniref:Glucose-6-phosphate 1-dehydrogenase n=1 Tax=Idiomarina fontislapidosi TaxID=263723 RepID=A0A432Y9E0_9GAMM|nr:glucose-6-phosphate dehydrogenase [Idiomarina fontislapidosi]PYE34468.1 glucose-6-phosphate 1-dehydrogenase [Idiomarina fontislapidosi]RUO57574.1 glucose-6-phosphate dehydrogenase [Idiomarina fontislapidosi]